MAFSAEVLRGRSALVTGGSQGIGRAIASSLAAAGVRTIIAARGAAALEQAGRELGVETVMADIADPAAVGHLADDVQGLLSGAPDILVNAAGSFTMAPLEGTPLSAFDAAIATNLRGPFALIRAFLPAMRQRGSGHIVTIGSVAGRAAFAGNAAYSAGKYGIRGLHAVLDAELRGTGVRSTLVEPAATDTALWDSIDFALNPGLPERSAMLPASAVADAVLFALIQAPDVAIRNIILERS